MAAVSSTVVAGPYLAEGVTPQMTTLTFTAWGGSGNDTFPVGTNGTLLIVQNTDAGAQTITISSTADSQGRKADITTFSIAASGIVARVFKPSGWENSLGSQLVEWTASDVGVEIVAIPL